MQLLTSEKFVISQYSDILSDKSHTKDFKNGTWYLLA